MLKAHFGIIFLGLMVVFLAAALVVIFGNKLICNLRACLPVDIRRSNSGDRLFHGAIISESDCTHS